MVYCPRNDRTPGHSPIHHKVQGLDYLYGFAAEGLGVVIVRVKADGFTINISIQPTDEGHTDTRLAKWLIES